MVDEYSDNVSAIAPYDQGQSERRIILRGNLEDIRSLRNRRKEERRKWE